MLKNMLGGLGDGFILTDRNEKVVFMNKAAEDLFEYTRLKKLRSKKQLTKIEDVSKLEMLGRKENAIADEIRTNIMSMSSKVEKKKYVDSLYSARSRQTNFVKKAYLANYGERLNSDDFHLDIRFLDGKDYYSSNIDLLVVVCSNSS